MNKEQAKEIVDFMLSYKGEVAAGKVKPKGKKPKGKKPKATKGKSGNK
jgi:hypothetical protein